MKKVVWMAPLAVVFAAALAFAQAAGGGGSGAAGAGGTGSGSMGNGTGTMDDSPGTPRGGWDATGRQLGAQGSGAPQGDDTTSGSGRAQSGTPGLGKHPDDMGGNDPAGTNSSAPQTRTPGYYGAPGATP